MGASAGKIELKDIEFHEKIGEGGSGSVHRVTFKKPYKGYTEVAAKKILESPEKEVEIMSKLHHPNIVPMFGFCQTEHIGIILLEYAPLGSLRRYLSDKTKDLPPTLMRKWIKEGALGIEYLHDNNILHRDVKANNCLLFEGYVLKLCDFGLAREIDHSQTTSSMKGTYRYMAHELIIGNEDGRSVYSKPADIYAYGMLILEICTRKPPFDDLEWQTVMFEVGQGVKPAVREDLPNDLLDIIQRCWNTDPKERPTIAYILSVLSVTVTGEWPLVKKMNLKHQKNPIHVWRVACCYNGDMVVDGTGRGELYIIGGDGDGDGESKMKLKTHEVDEEKQIGIVCGITISLQGHILIVDRSEYVKVYTNTGKYLHCFSTLTPDEDPNTKVGVRCITIDKKGHALISDEEREVITIHTCPDGTLVNKVKCSIGLSIAVNSKQQILYPLRPHGSIYPEIRAIDYTGNKVFTFIPRIDEDVTGGKVVSVRAIVRDADDNIYIAMLVAVKLSEIRWRYIPNTGHLHMYNPEGKYQRCIASGIGCPIDLTITPDHSQLVVAHSDYLLFYSLKYK